MSPVCHLSSDLKFHFDKKQDLLIFTRLLSRIFDHPMLFTNAWISWIVWSLAPPSCALKGRNKTNKSNHFSVTRFNHKYVNNKYCLNHNANALSAEVESYYAFTFQIINSYVVVRSSKRKIYEQIWSNIVHRC